jgi:Holliday junction DNA helicase RuvA
MTGLLVRIDDEDARIAIGPFEYQIQLAEAVRRQLQLRTGEEITLHISEYYEGNQSGTRFIPRKIGFGTEAELEFFELFCTVEKIGVKKALKAMARPVRDIADAIARQDAKWLTTLPGIGPAMAESIVTTLKRKVAQFAHAPGEVTEAAEPGGAKPVKKKGVTEAPAGAGPTGQVIDEVYQALMALGLSPIEARDRLDKLLQSREPFADASAAIALIFGKG